MSYLGFPRLHFSGYFQADPSTVNNDPTHFDDATFTPNDQLPGPGATNGWWNPRGTASWRLRDCTVKSVVYTDGSFCDDPNLDPVVGTELSGAESRVAAKLVDLDPEQQMVSEVWGLQLLLGEPSRPNGFKGEFDVAAFYDIWVRYPAGQPDSFFSAYYQSVISGVHWTHVDGSRVLRELAVDGHMPKRLSIKFNVDGYDDDRTSATFTWGRIVGTIGAYDEGEPAHFVAGRLMRTPQAALASPPTLTPVLNYAAFLLDEERSLLLADLGNTLPTTGPGGPMANVGHLQLALLPDGADPEPLGAVNYLSAGWYGQRAGIQAFPLTADQLTRAKTTPVGIVPMVAGKPGTPLLAENPGGWWVRADRFVYRLDAGDTATAKLYAMTFGQRAAGVQMDLAFNNAIMQGQVTQGPVPGPPVGVPPGALEFPASVTTDSEGVATVDLHGHDPRNPRGYIDGQVYGVGYVWNGVDQTAYNPNSSDVISVLVWDMYEHRGAPTWIDDVQPIFTQYANLYPVMKGIVDLAEYSSVVRRLQPLKLVFGLPVADPNYMPVTRDLSGPKRKMIRTWLDNPLYLKITNVNGLRRALQTAIELEHSTIPPYLTALYSIKEGRNTEVARIIRSVVIEEMLHMAMACNLLNAIGGHPSIDRPGFVPTYPGRLPGGLRPDLTVTLRKCSIAQLRDVFMSIEEPAVTVDPVEQAGQTIGWFYDRIEEAFQQLSERENLFTGDPARQVSEWKGVGNLVVVTDLASARAAIHEIVEQGEGASPINPEDGYDELAHYYKFAEIVHGRRIVLEKGGYSYTGEPIPFDEDGVWPMADDPNTQNLPPDSQQRLQSAEFNQIYRNLLEALHQVFNSHPDRLNAAVGLMFSLGLQAQSLMSMPIEPGLPQTVGPSFQYPATEW
jgi:rubrerythrin